MTLHNLNKINSIENQIEELILSETETEVSEVDNGSREIQELKKQLEQLKLKMEEYEPLTEKFYDSEVSKAKSALSSAEVHAAQFYVNAYKGIDRRYNTGKFIKEYVDPIFKKREELRIIEEKREVFLKEKLNKSDNKA